MKKVLSIVGALVVLGVGVFLYQQYFGESNHGYPNKPKVVEDSKRIRTFIDETDEGLDIYYLIKKEDGTDLRVDNVYCYDVVAPDYANENFIRFRDDKQEFVGLYNDKGVAVIPPTYSSLSKVHNGMLYGLKDAVKDNIGRNGDRHSVLLGGTTVLLNTKGEVLIEDMDTPNVSLDMFSLKLTDEPILESYYKSYKGVNGKYYNFVELEKYFEDFVKNDFLPSTKDNKWEKYLSDKVITDIEVKNENVGDYMRYTKDEMLQTQKHKVVKAFNLATDTSEEVRKLVYDVNDWVASVDEEVIEEKDKNIYMNEIGEWREAEFPIFELNIKEVHERQTRSNHFEFYRNKKGEMTLFKITIRANYY